jgi:hypothetical protein
VDDEDAGKERQKARELLAQIGKPAVRPLVGALERRFSGGGVRTAAGILNGAARMEVIKTLVEMGPAARGNDVLLTLVEVQRSDPFPGVRQAAREARVKLQEKE